MFDPDRDEAGPILGIDPGLTRCGYGAVRADASGSHAVCFGVLRTDPAAPLPERLAALQADVDALLADVRPKALAVERLLFQHNVRTAVAVGQASGVVLAVAAARRVPVTHYSPNEVKLAITGDGAADKAQVQRMVGRLLRLDGVPRSPDAADALALALCHVWGTPLRAIARADGAVGGTSRLRDAIARALAREEATS